MGTGTTILKNFFLLSTGSAVLLVLGLFLLSEVRK